MEDRNGFIPTQEIFVTDDLIGRNKKERELDIFVKSITQNKSNIQLISERRNGKSSILNCAVSEINKGKYGRNYIPLLINFKLYPNIKDINEGYCLICSALLNCINCLPIWVSKGFFTKRESIKILNNIKINKCKSIDEYFKLLKDQSVRGSRFFEQLIIFLAKNKKSVLLLIDEYESMFFNTFSGTLGSVHTIRDLTMKELEKNQIFRCSITGARSWDTYSQKIGSDDFNFIDDYLHLKPLSYDETFTLFKKSFNQSSGVCRKNLKNWIREINNIFNLSGGNPYIIKIIGNSFASTGLIDKKEIIKRLNPHFSNIWQRLSQSEKDVLLLKSHNLRIQNDVIDYGIALKKSKNTIEPLGTLWRNFISDIKAEEDTSHNNIVIDSNIIEIKQLGSEVINLITDINDILYGKNLKLVFDFKDTYNYIKYSNNLTIYSKNESSFAKFVSSLYFILFESTEGKVKGKGKRRFFCANYPEKFSRFADNEPIIMQYIDTFRHKYCDAHNVERATFKPKIRHREAQNHFLNHKNIIRDKEFFCIQKGLLQELINFLDEIKKWAEEQT